jgi:hypothetical protein
MECCVSGSECICADDINILDGNIKYHKEKHRSSVRG